MDTIHSTSDQVQRCTRCVMDTTDPDIHFDHNGVCNHCLAYDEIVARRTLSGAEAQRHLERLVERIQRAGKGKAYDCIIGVSGGVDSSYVAYRVRELGLRPLAVHLDNGWNSELAVKNIEQLLTKLEIELYTHVIDWEEFKDLQLAFLKASTPDSEIPSDHAIVALLHQIASREGVSFILSGCNARTESHLPKIWSQGHLDWEYIKSIHRQFGRLPLNTFPHITFWDLQRVRWTHEWVDILNYLDYSKKDALAVLENKLGWKYYGGKHYESIYTRFYQGYLLPVKFGFDKRKSHFSSLICSGEMTRDEAIEELGKPTYPPELQQEDKEYVMKKFGLTPDEFDQIMNSPVKRFSDYDSNERKYFQNPFYLKLKRVFHRLRAVVGGKVGE